MKDLNNQRNSYFVEKDETLVLTGKSLSDLIHAVISRGCAIRLRVKGKSMIPFIQEEDVITISPISKLHIGDIVIFHNKYRNNRLTVHRIIKKKKIFSL